VDIPPTLNHIAEATDSCGVVSGGKAVGKTAYGINGLNDYPGGGYDGPCPPWNDERPHQYHFQIFALDVASLNLTGDFTGQRVEAAMDGHVLEKAEVTGTYTNNAALLGR
jgi:Raf kinase inhibitor-like YbhB/YbcL family protein